MRAARGAILVAALALGGCSYFSQLSWAPHTWVMWSGGPAHKPTPLTPIQASVNPKAAWSASVGKSGGYAFRPVLADGRVYAAAANGVVTALEEQSGKVAARFDTGKPIAGGLQYADGHLFAGSIKGDVMSLDLSGKTAWSTALAGEVIAPPVVSRKVVVVRTSDGRIFGLSEDDGKRLWVFQRPTPSLLLRSAAGVLAIERDVLAGYPNGKLIALDLEDGKLTWEVTVFPPHGSTELERIADVAGLPLLDGTRACAAAFQGKLACFDIQTRNVVWSRDLSSTQAIVADAQNLYVVDDTGAVHALNKSTGASVWKQDKLAWRHLSSPVVVDGRVVVGDGFGFLHVLAPEDGAFVGRLATDGSAIESLVPTAGGLLVQTEKGSVVMVRF